MTEKIEKLNFQQWLEMRITQVKYSGSRTIGTGNDESYRKGYLEALEEVKRELPKRAKTFDQQLKENLMAVHGLDK